tara:strand:- start:110 stop:412 length:303 start_codon:yes stop_codon:yes gene_type:complete
MEITRQNQKEWVYPFDSTLGYKAITVRQERFSGDATIIKLRSALEQFLLDATVMPELRDLLSVCKEYTKDTSYYCGKGGHHVWVHNKNHNRVLFIFKVYK